eukprot:6160777-Heterocapsa_arctica.AAC.1
MNIHNSCPGGGLAAWRPGGPAAWRPVWLPGGLSGCLAALLFMCLAACLPACLPDVLPGRFVCLAGWQVAQRSGCLAARTARGVVGDNTYKQ